MKVIGFTIVDGFHYRYLIQSGIVNALLDNGHSVVVFTVPNLERCFDDFANKNLIVELLPRDELNIAKKLFLFLKSFESVSLSATVNIKNDMLRHQSLVRRYLSKALRFFFANTGISLSRFFHFAWRSPDVSEKLRKYKFDIFVTSTPGQKLDDIPFLMYARKFGLKTICPVYSWDNLTAKGPFAFSPDKICVWNDHMKDEAIVFHGYKPDNIIVCGVPVFDKYFDILSNRESFARDKFLRKLGFKADLPLVTIATIPQLYFGTKHRELVKFISSLVFEETFEQFNILIRPHPLDTTDYSDLENDYIKVDNYGGGISNNPKDWTPNDNTDRHLGETMLASSVVLNVASTITIDASCFDTPVINVAFDFSNPDYIGPVSRYYRYTHYQNVVKFRASDLVYSKEELTIALRRAFDIPKDKANNRSRLVGSLVGELDGNAFRRIVTAIETASLN